jgi:hypothetical protein
MDDIERRNHIESRLGQQLLARDSLAVLST